MPFSQQTKVILINITSDFLIPLTIFHWSSFFCITKIDLGIMVHPLAENMTSLMDIKVYGHSIQSGTNACDKSNKCSYICVGAPGKSSACLCPDGMMKMPSGECLCPGLTQPQANKTCPQSSNTCAPGFFTCANKLCIPNNYRCDGDDGKILFNFLCKLSFIYSTF